MTCGFVNRFVVGRYYNSHMLLSPIIHHSPFTGGIALSVVRGGVGFMNSTLTTEFSHDYGLKVRTLVQQDPLWTAIWWW